MGNISTKLNLAKLISKVIEVEGKGKKQVRGIFIPIEANNLFESAKTGAVYLDLIGFELNEKKEGSDDTHLVKQSLPKEVREKMTKEEQSEMPILGNHTVWRSVDDSFKKSSGSSSKKSKPKDDDDDLPF